MPGTFATTPLVGASFTERLTEPKFALGTTLIGDQDSLWIYVQADLAVNASQAPVMNATTFHLTAATAGSFTADTAFASGEFGFVRKTAAL